MAKTRITANDEYSLRKLGIDYSYWVYKNRRLNYRWKKKLLRDIFRMWYKTANEDGIYNEDYWKMTFDDGVKIRVFLWENIKGLPCWITLRLFESLFERQSQYEQKRRMEKQNPTQD